MTGFLRRQSMLHPVTEHRWTAGELTYREVGASRLGHLPPGYDVLERQRVVGHGHDRFHRAAEALLTWQLHRRAGLVVQAEQDRVGVGTDVRLAVGPGRLRVWAPCRVVYLVDEAEARGFAYGTLQGHPESGEESFVVRLLPDEQVLLSIRAFSRPALWWTRVAAPLSRAGQLLITQRYLHALDGT
jgi:uncharacterized protein (UPF0548 family)